MCFVAENGCSQIRIDGFRRPKLFGGIGFQECEALPETNICSPPEKDGFQFRNLRTSRGPNFSAAFAASFREGVTLATTTIHIFQPSPTCKKSCLLGKIHTFFPHQTSPPKIIPIERFPQADPRGENSRKT